MSDDERDPLPPRQLLEAALLVSPLVRSMPAHVLKRRVFVTKGNTREVVREATLGEALGGLIRASGLAMETTEGVRPKSVECMCCGKPFRLPAGLRGPLRRLCDACAQPLCAAGCGSRLSRKAVRHSASKRGFGKPFYCSKSCAVRHIRSHECQNKSRHPVSSKRRLTRDERSEIARKAALSIPAEVRAEMTRKREATKRERRKAAEDAKQRS